MSEMSSKQLELFAGHTGARPLPDEENRRRIRNDLDSTLFVEAAAGTGKTSELVGRVIAVLLSGRTTLRRMVALTFTDKAAGELKLRLREEIERERRNHHGPAARSHLEAALRELEAAQIGTIHSFCAELLREHPVQAGVDPLFETAAEDAAEQLLEEAFDIWFQRVLSDPPEGVRRLLRRRSAGRDGSGPRDLLRRASATLVEHRDFAAPWRRPADFDRHAAIDAVLEELSELAELASQAEHPEDYLARSLQEVAQFVVEQRGLEAIRGRDHDGLEARLRELLGRSHWRWTGRPGRRFCSGHEREEVIGRRDEIRLHLAEMVATADADLVALLQKELRPVLDEYERLKSHSGMLDFLDLLLRSRDLVRDNAEVRLDLQTRFSHFLVDEFQDTDPLQVELLLLLAADDPRASHWRTVRVTPGKLFLVGDPKQSIYRFRRADVTLYETVKQRLLAQGAGLVSLEASFRAVPSIQQAINAAFEPAMAGETAGQQARYVPLRPVRSESAGQPTVLALPVPRPYAPGGWRPRITQRQIEESYPDAVGALIEWLISSSGWTIHDRERDTRVPLDARHICLLFRRFSAFGSDLTRPYVRALEGRRIPHVVVGGRSFHAREEVLALRNALTAIEWPDDELSVFATLRGPFFALYDDQLLAFRQRLGRLHPLRRFDEEEHELAESEREVTAALDLLGRLHPSRNRRPFAATLLQLLEGVRSHAAIALWPTGEQALANVLQLLDLARRFESGGATSFRSFIGWLEQAAEQARAQEAPVVEEGTEGVRMMTVHKAKGLEFPVVILVDPTAALSRRAPSRHVDPARGLWAEALAGCVPLDLMEQADTELRRDAEEEIRLCYVAATRARDLLVVPVLGDSDEKGPDRWLDVLSPAVYPPVERQRHPLAAVGCPMFGPESVLDRPAGAEAMPHSSVAPGLHRPRAGEHSVVWWDPAALRLDVEERFGLTQQKLLEAIAQAQPDESAAREHRQWRRRLDRGAENGLSPLLQVEVVTRQAREGRLPQAGTEVEVQRTAVVRDGRPVGARFGTLVHGVLATVQLGADPKVVAATAAVQGRMLGATDAETQAATKAALAALAHPLLVQAASSEELRREAPITLRLDNGCLLEGVVDLAFKETLGEAWTVIDFKTDSDEQRDLQAYRAQVQLYADAVARSTGAPTHAVLLFV